VRWLALALVACSSSGGASHDATAMGSCGQDLTCAPAIPAGWMGYIALYDGPDGGAQACGAGFGTDIAAGSASPTAADATCGACTCGLPVSNVCAASGGDATLAAISWGQVGRACTPDLGAACANGGTCIAAAAPRLLCIQQTGDAACPTGSPFATPYVLYGGVTDTRGCTACTCGNAVMGACTPSGGAPTGAATPSMPVTYCCM